MKERPILFSGPMIRAILDGRKTQTRRVVKPQPSFCVSGITGARWSDADEREWIHGWHVHRADGVLLGRWDVECPHGPVGTRLWVRETWGYHRDFDATETSLGRGLLRYKATGHDTECPESLIKRWVPSIHMPRWASRITLEVTGVRVERVQEITNEDAQSEGIIPTATDNSADAFADLWNSINSKRGFGWDVNPWVWVITFKRIQQ